jgi:anti-anti-sigma factor
MAKRLAATAARDGERTHLWVSGELDLTTRDDLITAALEALAETPVVLDVDLSGVTFCDSSGISGLLAILRMSEGEGKRLIVSHPQHQVTRALEIAGVLDRLTDPAPG